MLRVLLRETLLTGTGLALVSLVAFAILDLASHQDWFATAAHADAVGMSVEHVTARDLPLYWNAHVQDAETRTVHDLAALRDPGRRTAARLSLSHRGIAALPYILPDLQNLHGDALSAALGVLARETPALTGGDVAPTDEARALVYWQALWDVRALDFRQGYALRQTQRLVSHASHNANEQITRLGTYALPAIFQVLAVTIDRDARIRLTDALADITGIPLRARPDCDAVTLTRIVEGWKAFWFAEHLEYETLSPWQRVLGTVTETRYGRWLTRALRGRFGVSAVTARPASVELRERLPTSAGVAGLGGLLATAFIVAFGGGPVLRRRALRPKLLDLAGALIPGLTALVAAWLLLVSACAPGNTFPLVQLTFEHWPGLVAATVALAVIAGQWLRRPALRVVLHAVRVEAEHWAEEGLSPGIREVLRHGLRIGVASLLAPMGLAAPAVLAASLVVEPMLRVRGMGTLTAQGLLHVDAPWLMVSTLSVVPILLGRRWARRSLVWLVTPHESDDVAVEEDSAQGPGGDGPGAVDSAPGG